MKWVFVQFFMQEKFGPFEKQNYEKTGYILSEGMIGTNEGVR